MNIDLFGTYFNLILDKIGLSVSQFWKYCVTISWGDFINFLYTQENLETPDKLMLRLYVFISIFMISNNICGISLVDI